jgi:P-type Cu2+ transporter
MKIAGAGSKIVARPTTTDYNVIAIPAAAGVLAHWGLVLGPAVGAALMSASTVICAVNARMLRLT